MKKLLLKALATSMMLSSVVTDMVFAKAAPSAKQAADCNVQAASITKINNQIAGIVKQLPTLLSNVQKTNGAAITCVTAGKTCDAQVEAFVNANNTFITAQYNYIQNIFSFARALSINIPATIFAKPPTITTKPFMQKYQLKQLQATDNNGLIPMQCSKTGKQRCLLTSLKNASDWVKDQTDQFTDRCKASLSSAAVSGVQSSAQAAAASPNLWILMGTILGVLGLVVPLLVSHGPSAFARLKEKVFGPGQEALDRAYRAAQAKSQSASEAAGRAQAAAERKATKAQQIQEELNEMEQAFDASGAAAPSDELVALRKSAQEAATEAETAQKQAQEAQERADQALEEEEQARKATSDEPTTIEPVETEPLG